MSERIVFSRAPSNIALIKYMGKKGGGGNIPENPSLSLTLQGLCTLAELEVSATKRELCTWVPELPRSLPKDVESVAQVPVLSDSAVARVVRHFERVKNALPEIFSQFSIELDQNSWKNSSTQLRTANTFPASSGIASSASSFAAVTLAVAAGYAKSKTQWEQAWKEQIGLRRELAKLSRMGSGSSCRSMEGPWVYWNEEETEKVETSSLARVAHFVVLIRTEPKQVSSSSAHERVRTSPLWQGRVERVHERVKNLRKALTQGDLSQVSRIAWSEAWEMHSLFHTSDEPFSYWEPGTLEGLQWFAPQMMGARPPIVTLDAGPNIHVIVDEADKLQWREKLREHFKGYVVLEDQQGYGAETYC